MKQSLSPRQRKEQEKIKQKRREYQREYHQKRRNTFMECRHTKPKEAFKPFIQLQQQAPKKTPLSHIIWKAAKAFTENAYYNPSHNLLPKVRQDLHIIRNQINQFSNVPNEVINQTVNKLSNIEALLVSAYQNPILLEEANRKAVKDNPDIQLMLLEAIL